MVERLEEIYINYVGKGTYKKMSVFEREARLKKASRALPASIVKGLNFGKEIFLGRYVSDKELKSEVRIPEFLEAGRKDYILVNTIEEKKKKKKQPSKKGWAFLYGYMVITGVTIDVLITEHPLFDEKLKEILYNKRLQKLAEELGKKVEELTEEEKARVRKDLTWREKVDNGAGGSGEVERGCGSYAVVTQYRIVSDITLKDLMEATELVAKQLGIKPRVLVEGPYIPLEKVIVVKDAVFSRSLLKTRIIPAITVHANKVDFGQGSLQGMKDYKLVRQNDDKRWRALEEEYKDVETSPEKVSKEKTILDFILPKAKNTA